MSAAARYAMGRETPAENDIFYAVRGAIDSGMDAAEFIKTAREAWGMMLDEKRERDDATFKNAKVSP